MIRLSKSRIMSFLQCPRRAHLEVHRRDLAHYSKATLAAFESGHELGALAIELYDPGGGALVEYKGGSFGHALAQTEALMNALFPAPIFEATLQYEGVLVREDVLLPVDENGRRSWSMVEIKSSTRLKPEYFHDCAIQAWVHLQSGYPLSRVALGHVDKGFVYEGDGNYRGLIVEHEISDQVFELLPSVPIWVDEALAAVEGEMPEVRVGQHCTSPNECPFMGFCWPQESRYPVQGLGGSKERLGAWVAEGYRDLRDIPTAEIDSEIQLRIQRITRKGEAELLPGARAFAKELAWPRFYLDFETVGPAIPQWAGTRPYQTLPFQWSCHIERETGSLEHREFLELDPDRGNGPPTRRLAEALIMALESEGPVLMYTNFERTVIGGLAELFPDLSGALEAIDARLVDLFPVTRDNYYHPDMLGSWSIKAVLPTIAPDMDYAGLKGIAEGTEASKAYLEAMAPDTSAARREQLRSELFRYCKHDTEAMVRLVRFFRES